MYRVSFLTNLDIHKAVSQKKKKKDIHKAYFKGRYTRRTYAESDLVHYSL